MFKNITRFLIIILFLVPLSNLHASSRKAEGYFTLTKDCPAYRSLKQKGPVDLQKGEKYKAHQINTKHGLEWINISVPEANPPARWVKLSCGALKEGEKDFCKTAGNAEGNILAISWQPGFCETEGKYKEDCKKFEEKYRNTYLEGPRFTLHGLWPVNLKHCGDDYRKCIYNTEPCRGSYNLTLDTEVIKSLEKVMPGLKHGNNLDRHEWCAHGICQKKWDKNEYFKISIGLVKDFKRVFGGFMSRNMGKVVKKSALEIELKRSFGENAITNICLCCQNGNILKELRIYLPKHIKQSESIKELIKNAPIPDKHFHESNCRCAANRIEIDRWGD